MRDNVLTRKKAGLILMLAKALKVTPEKALGVFYPTNVNRMLSDSRFGLQLMCNRSLVRDVMAELRECGDMKSKNQTIMKSGDFRHGSALLVVLGMLSFMLFSGLAFSVYMRQSRLPTSFLRRTVTTRQLAKAALAEAIEEIDRAIGNDPHPNVHLSSGEREAGKEKEGEDSDSVRNFWSHRVFVGKGGSSHNNDPDEYVLVNNTKRYPALVEYSSTVPTLSLEGLAYLPPNLINEARYYSRRTPTAQWKPFWFDSGRYAYAAIDVSDYFDINRIKADKPRAACASQRISFAHLFEKDDHSGADGTLAADWDGFISKIASERPFFSLADLNIALGGNGIAGFQCPFRNFLKDEKLYETQDSYDAKVEKYRGMTFVTDGWFPKPKKDKTPNTDRTRKDLMECQPFGNVNINTEQPTIEEFSTMTSDIVRSESGDADLFLHLCSLGLAQLWDYLDENRVPVSLAVPTLERVPMVVGIEPTLPQLKIESETNPKSLGYQQGKDIQVSQDPNPPVAGSTRTYQRTVDYKLTFSGNPAARALLAYPFRNHGIERRKDQFTIDGRLAVFLTTGGQNMKMRVGNANAALHVDSPNDFSKDGVQNNSVFCIPIGKNVTVSSTDFDGEDDPPVIHRNLTGNISTPDVIVCRVTYEWVKEAWNPNMNGQGQGGWDSTFTPAHAAPLETEIMADDSKTFCKLNPLLADGSLDSRFSTASALQTLLGNANATIKINAAVWVRVRHNDALLGDKTVDLVPACVYDDKNFIGVNHDSLANDTSWGDVFFSDGYPLLRYDVFASGGSASNNGEIPFTTAALGNNGTYSFEVRDPVTSQGRNLQIVVNDPRYNHLPENWYFSASANPASEPSLEASDWVTATAAMLGQAGRDSDYYLATSDRGVMQSVYELAFLPRFTDLTESGRGNARAGGYYHSPNSPHLTVNTANRTTFGTQASEALDYNIMWRTYHCYDANGETADPFEEIGLTCGENGQKVNPYSDSAKVLMAALANTPRDWRVSATNKAAQSSCELEYEGKGKIKDMAETADFNNYCAWNGYSEDTDCRLKWKDLENVAMTIYNGVRDLDAGETWEDVFSTLSWYNSDPSQFLGTAIGNTKLYGVDRKFLYGFWHDSFAVRQQLFLIFVRAEPMMMGGGVTGQTPPQLGARAVALVWRDPTARDSFGKVTTDRPTDGAPHPTRILFYHQFD